MAEATLNEVPAVRDVPMEPAAIPSPSILEPALASHKYLIAFAVVLAALMQVIDSSIVNVALPDMMGNLGANIDEIAWVSTGYILASVIVTAHQRAFAVLEQGILGQASVIGYGRIYVLSAGLILVLVPLLLLVRKTKPAAGGAHMMTE